MANVGLAQELSGPLNGTYGPGIYTVVGDLSIAEGDSVILLPGTTFLFQGANNYSLDIDGYFYAVGTESDSIKFTPDAPGSNWTGIDFNNPSDDTNRLEYCLITGSTQSGVDCFTSSPTISHSAIIDNTAGFGGGIYVTSGAPTITDCLIKGNSTQVCGAGIWASSSQPTITNCFITENNAGNSSGGIYCYSADAVITDCVITWNSSYAGAGGIFCRNVEPIVSNCIITDNTTVQTGGGINMNNTNARVDRCVIARNMAGISGGGIDIYISTPTITNCTISGNHADQLGGGIESFDSNPEIINTIIEGNTGFGGIYFFNSLGASITYCDIFDNEDGNFTGTVPAGLGVVSTTNTNGDSCDQFCNLQFDPLFYATSGDSAYYLTEDSPCIDAGDPTSPLDPDNTIADIGMYYYHQEGTPSPVTVTLTPYGMPIQIPATGGSFDFNIAVENSDIVAQTFDAWIMVTLSGGTQLGPALGPVNLSLEAGVAIDRDRTQLVPETAPVGIYNYEAYIGTYPNDIWDEDSFDFEKLDDTVGMVIGEWYNTGDEFGAPNSADAQKLLTDFALISAYPNPLNPQTTLRFDLPEDGHVSLGIYNISGRKVATLYNGFCNAGIHHTTFVAENLPSGVYLAVLTAGDHQATQKLLLVK